LPQSGRQADRQEGRQAVFKVGISTIDNYKFESWDHDFKNVYYNA